MARLHLVKWNRSKIGTNGRCVYTRTLGTVPFGTTIRTLLDPLNERSFRFQCKRAEPNGTVPEENGYEMRVDSFVYCSISQTKYQRKLDFCDLAHHPPLFLLLLEPFGTFLRLHLKCGIVPFSQA